MAAGEKGRALYEKLHGKPHPEPAFFPHLSIAYGNLPKAQKEEIVAKVLGGQREVAVGMMTAELELWATGPDVRRWRLLKVFPLLVE